MTTQTFGADPNYATVPFYNKHGAYDTEVDRVNGLFSRSSNENLPVIKRDVPFEELIKHLKSGHPIIVLVDAAKLLCGKCKPTLNKKVKKYCGHFIVLSEYSEELNVIAYLNPSSNHSKCFCDPKQIEIAWRSYGTDEDLIWIDGYDPGGVSVQPKMEENVTQ